MNDHEVLPRAAKLRLRHLHTPRVGRFLYLIALDWIAIALSMFAVGIAWNPVVLVAAMVVIGSRQHALLILAHDGAHRLATTSKGWNDCLTQLLCLWPTGVSLHGYRRFHWIHHREAGGPGDSELPLKSGRLYDGSGTSRQYYARILRGLCGFDILRFIRQVAAVRSPHPSETLAILVYQAVIIALFTCFGLLWVVGLWWLCILTTCWTAFSVREWGEHIGIVGTHRLEAPAAIRWLCYPHNSQMHYEHHEYPYVPCWRLSEARAIDQRREIVELGELIRHQLPGAWKDAGRWGLMQSAAADSPARLPATGRP